MKGMILQRVREETGVADLVDLRLFLGEVNEEGAVEEGAENRGEIEPKDFGGFDGKRKGQDPERGFRSFRPGDEKDF